MRRILTALALIPIVVYVVLWANYWVFLGVVALSACLCYREYNDIAAAYGFGKPGLLGYAAGLVLLAWPGWQVLVAAAVVAFLLSMRMEDLSKALPHSALVVTGIVYAFGCWIPASGLRAASPHWLMFALVLNWVGDTGAYVVGRRFGKHKLAPRVSPKKSWEGAAASVVTAVLFAGAYLVWFVRVPVLHAVLLTSAANIAGQLGDLAESAIKRGAGVKDSSSILPGHGGFLDRVDSTLFALPVVYAYVRWTL